MQTEGVINMAKFCQKGVFFTTFSILVGCGLVNRSHYNKGIYGGQSATLELEDTSGEPNSANAGSLPPRPTRPQGTPPPTDEMEILNTGTPQCIQQHFEKIGKDSVKPATLSSNIDDLIAESYDTNNPINLYDFILRKIVTPDTGLVNYDALKPGGEWETAWNLVVTLLSQSPFPGPESTQGQRIAFWTNAYNIHMIDLVVRTEGTVTSDGKVNTKLFRGSPKKYKRNYSDLSLSLDDIEKRILRLTGFNEPIDTVTSPDNVDPRLHFALVCGAKSCPRLRNFAYRETNIERALDENAHLFFNDSQNHFFLAGDQYKFSSLLSFFPGDFDILKSRFSLADYVVEGCRSDSVPAKSFLSGIASFEELKASGVDVYVAYDWTLNKQ